MELSKVQATTVSTEELRDCISLLHLMDDSLIGEDYTVIKKILKKEFNKNVSIEQLQNLYQAKYNYELEQSIIEDEEDFFDGF